MILIVSGFCACAAAPSRPAHTFDLADPRYLDWLFVAADTIGYDLISH